MCFVAWYVALYAAYALAYAACASSFGVTTPEKCTIALTAAGTAG
tara:strand:+ start:731 stop:865 length:135 start_codon:yes stop_codon:yes gene_type:complete